MVPILRVGVHLPLHLSLPQSLTQAGHSGDSFIKCQGLKNRFLDLSGEIPTAKEHISLLHHSQIDSTNIMARPVPTLAWPPLPNPPLPFDFMDLCRVSAVSVVRWSPLLTICVALGKSPPLSMPWFPHLYNGVIVVPTPKNCWKD